MMTDEELDKARAAEAWRVFSTSDADFTIEALGEIAARLAREGWTPPVDPDLLVAREIAAKGWGEVGLGLSTAETAALVTQTLAGSYDTHLFVRAALAAYKAGREAEAERAKVLLAALDDMQKNSMTVWSARASAALAAYKAGKATGKGPR
ncbi:MAG: hypothetical protein RI988_3466 [Pseudomonadota bacterium]|jgi:hypothetical protein